MTSLRFSGDQMSTSNLYPIAGNAAGFVCAWFRSHRFGWVTGPGLDRPNDREPSEAERTVVELLQGMLADADWMIPIVEAQVQYRVAYYGMTAAALLEDVFFDALANYTARHKASIEVTKASRGDRHWDYAINGLELSHKNILGPTATAVHWDATVERALTWSSSTPMIVVSADYSRRQGELLDGQGERTGAVRVGSPPPTSDAGRSWCLLRWDPDGHANVAHLYPGKPLQWGDAWPQIASLLDSGVPASQIEILLLPAGTTAGFGGSIRVGVRPGVYFFPQAWLVDVPVSRNNRGTLIPQQAMAALMERSASAGLWTPMPTWPAAYAAPRPPDLYLAQRTTFDRRFSPATQRD